MRPLHNTTGAIVGLEGYKDMKTRLITAAIGIPALLVVVLLLPNWVTAWMLAIMCAVGAYELLYRTEYVRHMRLVIYSCAAAFLTPLLSHYFVSDAWSLMVSLVFVSLLFMEVLLAHTKVRLEAVTICVLAGLIIPGALSSLIRILDMELGRYLILLPFVLAFMPDTGGYFVGRFFGKHRLAPVISPNKTVEGAIGGVVTGLMFTILYVSVIRVGFNMEVDYIFSVIYGFVGSAAAVFGDLCLSAVKRQAGIKDYGNLLPGHGGVLDRFDSVIFVAPLTEALLDIIPLLG